MDIWRKNIYHNWFQLGSPSSVDAIWIFGSDFTKIDDLFENVPTAHG